MIFFVPRVNRRRGPVRPSDKAFTMLRENHFHSNAELESGVLMMETLMFKLGYHRHGAILTGAHILMTRLAAKQRHHARFSSDQISSSASSLRGHKIASPRNTENLRTTSVPKDTGDKSNLTSPVFFYSIYLFIIYTYIIYIFDKNIQTFC